MNTLVELTNKACALYASSIGRFRGHDIILCYHSVRDSGRSPRGWLGPQRSLDSAVFEAQMRWLSEVANVVSLTNLLESPGNPGDIRVAVTFDDGYFDNIDVAIPIMKRYGIPMTWFVATDFVDNSSLLPWWDLIDLALAQCREPITLQSNTVAGVYDPNITPQRQWLNTTLRTILKSSGPEKRDEIAADLRLAISRQLDIPSNSFARAEEIAAAVARGGVDLGGHTASHPNLALCQPDELATELLRGKDRLETISGQSPRWFAYPFGGKGAFNPAAADAVRDAAFDGACTLLTGTVRVDTGRYAVPRIAVSPAMTMETFRARVKGAPLYTGMEKIHSAMSKKRRYG